jgi:hypothetical protein
MTRSARTSLQRIDTYVSRLRRDLEANDRAEAMSNAAELCEIARRLWCYLADQEGYSCVEMQIRSAAGGEN